jgi:anti-sigma factor RsiW
MTTLVCQDLVEVVTDHLEGALPPADDEAVRAHLAGCDSCRLYVEQMVATAHALHLLGEHPHDPPSVEGPDGAAPA